MDDIKELLIQLMEGQTEIKQKIDRLETSHEELKSRMDKLESKLETKIESVDSKVMKLAEIQQAHFEQNARNHEEIVEMLSGKIDNHERAIKKLNIVK